MARVAPALRPVESRPTVHVACAAQRGLNDLACLFCRPTRGTLLSTPSAGARPHQHRDRSAARLSRGRIHHVRIPRRASRARFVPWKIGHRPRSMRRAARTWRGCVVGQRRRALFHAVGRRPTAPTSRQVGGTAFDTSYSPRSKPAINVVHAFRPVEKRTTTHGARARWRT